MVEILCGTDDRQKIVLRRDEDTAVGAGDPATGRHENRRGRGCRSSWWRTDGKFGFGVLKMS
jgi:hypothetical protein